MTEVQLNQLSENVLDAAFMVHRELGPGLLENAYKACLVHQLRKQGIALRLEVPVPVVYDGQQLADIGYRIDILVEDEFVLEIKALEVIAPVHKAQLVSYLKLSGSVWGCYSTSTLHCSRTASFGASTILNCNSERNGRNGCATDASTSPWAHGTATKFVAKTVAAVAFVLVCGFLPLPVLRNDCRPHARLKARARSSAG